MKWFRCYIDILDDHKIHSMHPEAFKVMMFIFAYCCEKDNDGMIKEGAEELMWRMRYLSRDQVDTFTHAIAELEDLNIIEIQDSCLIVLNWNKRQYKSDNRTAQTRKRRRKLKDLGVSDKSESIHESTPDTDTDSETKTESNIKPIKKANLITIEEKGKVFIKKVMDYNLENKRKYDDDMLSEFCDYWLELDINSNKYRFQGEKYFSFGRRLATWNKNNKKYNSDKNFDSGKIDRSIFRLDRTGEAYIGYCGKCGISDFYSKYEPQSLKESKCCKGKVYPEKLS